MEDGGVGKSFFKKLRHLVSNSCTGTRKEIMGIVVIIRKFTNFISISSSVTTKPT